MEPNEATLTNKAASLLPSASTWSALYRSYFGMTLTDLLLLSSVDWLSWNQFSVFARTEEKNQEKHQYIDQNFFICFSSLSLARSLSPLLSWMSQLDPILSGISDRSFVVISEGMSVLVGKRRTIMTAFASSFHRYANGFKTSTRKRSSCQYTLKRKSFKWKTTRREGYTHISVVSRPR